jgi:hypothetical protein
MIKKIKKLYSTLNKRITLYGAKGSRSGFVILFAVTISSILLSIALGVANVALNQLSFSTSARATNNAFFAADTGIECALLHDRSNDADNAFTGSASMNCAGVPVTISGADPLWSFIVTGLGSSEESCTIVTVSKILVEPYTFTTITSKGFNVGDALCESSSSSRIEREIRISY